MKRLSKRRKEVLRGYGVETILEEYKPFARKIKRLAPHEELQPYKHGQLSARQAKKNTREASIVDSSSSFYYNMKENWIDDCHHSVSATDMHANNLIEIDPDTNKLIWHGDVCVVCAQPPCTWGEIMLAQYGHTEFICVDCGKVVGSKGLGMKGFENVQQLKAHIKKRKITTFKSLEEDEEDEC